MINLELIQLFISATMEALVVTELTAYNKEIVDGGTKNRIWSFLSVAVIISFAFSPLTQLFPGVDFSVYRYASLAASGLIYYVASVAHQNQIYINENEPDKVKRLPLGLHKSKFLMKSALFLSRYLAYVFIVGYFVLLAGCIAQGAFFYGFSALAMCAVNTLYQKGYFPMFLRNPYIYLNLALCLTTVFGVTTPLGIGLSSALIAFTVYDYVRCYWTGKNSPTAQFPIADPNKKLTVPPIEKNDPVAREKLSRMIHRHLQYSRGSGLQVTFDHFYQSHRIMDRLLKDLAQVNYEDYLRYFNQIDFNNQAFRELILNEMATHDKFHEKGLKERCLELSLPLQTELVDVEIAFLRREMGYFVERLKNPDYRDLSHLQLAYMHSYARLILPKIQQLPSLKINDNTILKKDALLLSLAIRTGSHCNRVYLDTLTSIADEFQLIKDYSLTLQEEAVLAVQTAREHAFREYYYKTATRLKSKNWFFALRWQDLNDYHTYEDFVDLFGSNFYLRNPSLMMRFRTIFNLIQDRYFSLFFFLSKIAFSDTYNVQYLRQEILKPTSKLHLIFLKWCEERFPSCYKGIVYDEDHLLNTGRKIEALAELMLLDLDIVALKDPYPSETAILPAVTRPASQLSLTPRQSLFPLAAQQAQGSHGAHFPFWEEKHQDDEAKPPVVTQYKTNLIF